MLKNVIKSDRVLLFETELIREYEFRKPQGHLETQMSWVLGEAENILNPGVCSLILRNNI